MPTNGPVFAKRIEQVDKTKHDLELDKIVDCFLDACGSYKRNIVTLEIKTLPA